MTDSSTSKSIQELRPKSLGAGAIVAVVLFFAAGWLDIPEADKLASQLTAAITGFVATSWLTGSLPLGAASLLPMVLFPIFGVANAKTAAAPYAHPIIWMFFGGFVLALGVERWGLHHRIALVVIQKMGVQPNRLILGFMIAACFLSMWLNNTATTLLLLPIALAIVESMRASGAVRAEHAANFAFALLLGVAYACSVGGIATPISTAPNALYLSNVAPLEQGGAPPMTFLMWSSVGIPAAAIMLPLVWFVLVRFVAPPGDAAPEAAHVIAKEAAELAPISKAEKRIAACFGLAGLLWVMRRDVGLGEWGTIPGWWNLLPVEKASDVPDGVVAVVAALIAFVVPSGKKGVALMNWTTAKTIPWDILLLIGGGMSIANAFNDTGLAAGIANILEPMVGGLHPMLLTLAVCLLVTFLTEFTSNTATTALILPILLSTAMAAKVDPRLLMLPAAMSASFAFMLPIATPPNAIVFASGHIPMKRMARAGLWMNLLGAVVINLVLWIWAIPLLGIETSGPPSWLP